MSNLYWLVLLYGIQGVPYGFQVAFLPILLHADGASLTKVSLLRALNLPWMLKLLWVPMVTSSASIKRPLTYSLAGLSFMFAVSSMISSQATLALGGVLLSVNILASIQDIAVDTFAIQTLTEDNLGKGNAVQVVGYKIGAMLGGGVLTWASEFCSWPLLMMFLATTYLIMAVLIFLCLPPISTVSDTDKGNHKKSVILTTQDHHDSLNDFRKGDENGHFPRKSTFNSANHTEMNKPDDRNDAYQVTQTSHRYNLRSSSRTNKTHLSSNSSRDNHIETGVTQRTDVTDDASLSDNSSEANGETLSRIDERMQGRYQLFASVLRVPGTPWLLSYLLTYKLGEQGAVSIFPLYLMDVGMTTNGLVLWMGLLAQWVSIAGSLLGGRLLNQNSKHRSLSVDLGRLSLLRFITLCSLAIMMWFNNIVSPLVLCLPVYLILLLGGAITTATFTTMMKTSQGASPPALQTLHHTSMATAEVLGKVVFTALAGLLVDQVGYVTAYVTFATLSVFPLLPLCRMAPMRVY